MFHSYGTVYQVVYDNDGHPIGGWSEGQFPHFPQSAHRHWTKTLRNLRDRLQQTLLLVTFNGLVN